MASAVNANWWWRCACIWHAAGLPDWDSIRTSRTTRRSRRIGTEASRSRRSSGAWFTRPRQAVCAWGVQATAARMSQETVAAEDMIARFAQWQHFQGCRSSRWLRGLQYPAQPIQAYNRDPLCEDDERNAN